MCGASAGYHKGLGLLHLTNETGINYKRIVSLGSEFGVFLMLLNHLPTIGFD